MPHLLVHFLAHEIVEVTDSPSAVAKPSAGVLLGSPWALHDAVHRNECQHTDVSHCLTPRIAIVRFSRSDSFPLDIVLIRKLCRSTYISFFGLHRGAPRVSLRCAGLICGVCSPAFAE